MAGCGAPAGEAGVSSSQSLRAGALLSAGANGDGQLGRDSAAGFGPVRGVGGNRDLTATTVLAAGRAHSLAIRTGGVLAWGANDQGQLGDGTRKGSAVPVAVRAADGAAGALRGVRAIGAGGDLSMALLADGSVVTWGRGTAGRRGTGKDRETALTPTTVLGPSRSPLLRARQISTNGATSMAVLTDGTVVGWGSNPYGQLGPGAAAQVLLGRRVLADTGIRLEGVAQVAVGGRHVVAVRGDGVVLSWGRNETGQLGDGKTTTRIQPDPVNSISGSADLQDVASVSTAADHTVALRTDGTVLAWGGNGGGRLGVGDARRRLRPVPVVGAQRGRTLRSAIAVVAGENFGAALLGSGEVLTWGVNRQGQLGTGDTEDRDRPGPVAPAAGMLTALRANAIGAGDRHLLVQSR